jgi:penicillin-binding protein 1C
MVAPVAAPSVTIEDRHGIVLRTTRAADGSRAKWTPLAEIDPKIITAFVAVEDRRFLEREGALDWRALARATRDNLLARRVVSGASTIPMQTARLIRPVERSWSGKVVQVLWALRLAAHLDRQQMLEQYLNRVHLGQGAVGVSSAVALYFGGSAREVSLGQAALLAGIARAPSTHNPFVSPRRARARRSLALRRILGAGYATPDAVALAEREPVATSNPGAPFLAPHFTTRVIQWEEPSGEHSWRTSLDISLQREIEAEVRRTVDDLRDRGARQAAAIVLNNRTGEILAWVGSPDFWADTAGQTDMVISPRQPGSALKPFLYGLAFDRGYTPATIIADIARTYQTATGPYRPRNYDQRFHGPVRAREALASSYNVPAVELSERVSARSLLDVLHLAGFESLRRSADHYGLGLALGNGDVTLLEIANAFRALANGGVWRPYTWRLVEPGAVPRGEERRIMTATSAALVLDIVSDADARIPGFGLRTPLEFPFRVAAKTGTSRHFTDNWAVATTAGFTAAVWVGNFSGRPMEGVSGVSGAGPLLHRAVLLTARRYAPGELPSPASVGAVTVEICRLSGLRATPECPHRTEWFVPGTEPAAPCDWHRDGGVVLPAEYAEWVDQRAREDGRSLTARLSHGVRDPGLYAASASGWSTGDTSTSGGEPDAAPRFRITSPMDGDRYMVPPGVDARYATVALRASGARDGSVVRWYVDGRAWPGGRLRLAPGTHVITARAGREVDEVRIVVE